jgi:hypothetical protein
MAVPEFIDGSGQRQPGTSPGDFVRYRSKTGCRGALSVPGPIEVFLDEVGRQPDVVCGESMVNPSQIRVVLLVPPGGPQM